jgi:hypothetical protein
VSAAVAAVLEPLADFARSRDLFEGILSGLQDEETVGRSHGEIEEWLDEHGRDLLRQMFQDHLDRRAVQEERREDVVDARGVPRGSVEAGHARPLTTIFGDVDVVRLAYRRRGEQNLYPADGILNLPVEEHSHGLRRLAAIEAAEGSFESAQAAIERSTGQKVGKRQVEGLAARAALDFDAFYTSRPRSLANPTDVLVITLDGKGIVMRPEGLRESTQKAAAKAARKLQTRLSRGEKGNRKRMAEVGCVYDTHPIPRTPDDILAGTVSRGATRPAPRALNKWAVASVVEEPAAVVAKALDEAERRDPGHERTWVGLVDGNAHQIDLIRVEARRRGVQVSIVVDFVHVLEYLWKAAWSFFSEGEAEAEIWVRQKALEVLRGRAGHVAASISRTATKRGLDGERRKGADAAAGYLLRKRAFLDYKTALAAGWPIATGVIEGLCRHLVKDRLDLTGARWGLAGAEAVLKLRTIRTNRDFAAYWRFHVSRERRRIHERRYLNELVPGSE